MSYWNQINPKVFLYNISLLTFSSNISHGRSLPLTLPKDYICDADMP